MCSNIILLVVELASVVVDPYILHIILRWTDQVMDFSLDIMSMYFTISKAFVLGVGEDVVE